MENVYRAEPLKPPPSPVVFGNPKPRTSLDLLKLKTHKNSLGPQQIALPARAPKLEPRGHARGLPIWSTAPSSQKVTTGVTRSLVWVPGAKIIKDATPGLSMVVRAYTHIADVRIHHTSRTCVCILCYVMLCYIMLYYVISCIDINSVALRVPYKGSIANTRWLKKGFELPKPNLGCTCHNTEPATEAAE